MLFRFDVRIWILFAAVGLTLVSSAPTQAQSAPHRSARPAPPSGQQAQRSRPQSSSPAGSGVPSWAESASPPSYKQSPRGRSRPQSAPAPGPGDDPDNVPLGGAEWLAAAGAAYAVRRLQKRGIAESEDDDA
jgi:hypothetical protein